jgi:hypothetical protein
MIAIFCSSGETDVACEFFQLFKTPWELYQPGHPYDVVLTTCGLPPALLRTPAQLVISYSARPSIGDAGLHLAVAPTAARFVGDGRGLRMPIYGQVAALEGAGRALLRDEDAGKAVALLMDWRRPWVVRVGYDLLGEVAQLLTDGQPAAHALMPTLERHVAWLRDVIVDAGLPVVEIPPTPCGHAFIACLTHDVDFAGIRQHRLDHTFWGFMQRAILGSVADAIAGRRSWAQVRRNWSAVASLPLVYAGLRPDPWDPVGSYAAVEGQQPSTFFLIPFKDRPGEHVAGLHTERRATRYDVGDLIPQINRLAERGCEVGVHGIDAWHDAEQGRQELQRIAEATGCCHAGVRMHWLCFDRTSPEKLEQAGFDYDSTVGYNETVGFRAGTTQVFRPLGATRLLELPLHVQDTALFFPGRMHLTEDQAWELCQPLLDAASRHGGVVTILWHERSLAPERLWDRFYVRLLDELRTRNAWLATAGQAVDWFRQRRAVCFERCRVEEGTLRVALQADRDATSAGLILRVNLPGQRDGRSWRDVRWAGETELAIPLAQEARTG